MMIIDRFEGDIAVIECDDGMIDISRDLLPENAVEGDVIVSDDCAYYVDTEATEIRRKALRERFNCLKGGAE